MIPVSEEDREKQIKDKQLENIIHRPFRQVHSHVGWGGGGGYHNRQEMMTTYEHLITLSLLTSMHVYQNISDSSMFILII